MRPAAPCRWSSHTPSRPQTFLASVSLRLSFFFSAARRGLRLDSATYVELHGLAFQSGLIFQVEAFDILSPARRPRSRLPTPTRIFMLPMQLGGPP